jgi:hypothetical protein
MHVVNGRSKDHFKQALGCSADGPAKYTKTFILKVPVIHSISS